MRKYLVTAVLIASPAFAEEFYGDYDGKRREMFSHKPGGKMNLDGALRHAKLTPSSACPFFRVYAAL